MSTLLLDSGCLKSRHPEVITSAPGPKPIILSQDCRSYAKPISPVLATHSLVGEHSPLSQKPLNECNVLIAVLGSFVEAEWRWRHQPRLLRNHSICETGLEYQPRQHPIQVIDPWAWIIRYKTHHGLMSGLDRHEATQFRGFAMGF